MVPDPAPSAQPIFFPAQRRLLHGGFRNLLLLLLLLLVLRVLLVLLLLLPFAAQVHRGQSVSNRQIHLLVLLQLLVLLRLLRLLRLLLLLTVP